MTMEYPPVQVSIVTPEIVTVSYDDLLAFDTTTERRQQQQQQQHVSLVEQIGNKAFGRHGLGIVIVSNVPNFSDYRNALLPLAAQIPDLIDATTTTATTTTTTTTTPSNSLIDARSYYSVGWSHGKEVLSTTGQPDWNKGSYYANPLTDDLLRTLQGHHGPSPTRTQTALEHPEFFANNLWPPAPYLPTLRPAFCTIGQLLHRIGCIIAKVCDLHCANHGITTNIARMIGTSFNATGRLLHYFPTCTPTTAQVASHNQNQTHTHTNDSSSDANNNDKEKKQQLWCSWHNDHVRFVYFFPVINAINNNGIVRHSSNRIIQSIYDCNIHFLSK
jgi:hypothetical protein